MDFLRRLNPTNAALASAARPVLAPRFAPQRRAGEFDTTSVEVPSATGPVSEALEPRRDLDHSVAAPKLEQGSVVRPTRPGRASAPPMPGRESLDADPPAHSADPGDARRQTAVRVEPQGLRARAAMSEPGLAVATAPIPAPIAAQITAAAEVRPDSDPTAARPAPPKPSAPLSDQALASRSVPVAPARPVIQVTIDRIDVRAPAAPQRPAAVKRPAQEPSVSLADYLRPGRAARGGGSSS